MSLFILYLFHLFLLFLFPSLPLSFSSSSEIWDHSTVICTLHVQCCDVNGCSSLFYCFVVVSFYWRCRHPAVWSPYSACMYVCMYCTVLYCIVLMFVFLIYNHNSTKAYEFTCTWHVFVLLVFVVLLLLSPLPPYTYYYTYRFIYKCIYHISSQHSHIYFRMPFEEASSRPQEGKGEKVTVIGSFKIGHLLGKGSFCKVKLATHIVTGQQV